MKGYFAIGIEGASKPMNTGNLIRSAHALAAFIFTVDAHLKVRERVRYVKNASLRAVV